MSSVGAVLAPTRYSSWALGQDQRAGASGPAWILQLPCTFATSNGAQQPCVGGISFSSFTFIKALFESAVTRTCSSSREDLLLCM